MGLPAVDKFAPARASPPRGTGRGPLSFWGLTCVACPCNDAAMKTLTDQLVLRIDPETRAKLQALADENDRTEAAEARRAIRFYLDAAA